MEFIELTKLEYKRILKRRIRLAPASATREVGEMAGAQVSRKNRGKVGLVLRVILGLWFILPFSNIDLSGILFEVGMIFLFPLCVIIVMILWRTSDDRRHHKKFIKKLKG